MFLSPDDLSELTGLKRPSAQARWLFRAGMRYAISADGQVRVLRAEVERMMLSGPVKAREPALRLVSR